MLTLKGEKNLIGSQPLIRIYKATDDYWERGRISLSRGCCPILVIQSKVIIPETLYTSTDYSYIFMCIIGEEVINLRVGRSEEVG